MGQVHAPREHGWPGRGLCLPHRRGAAGGTAAWLKCTPLAVPVAVPGARPPHLLSEQGAPGSSAPGCTWPARCSHGREHMRPVPTGRPERPPRAVLGTCASPPPAKSPTAFDPAGGGGHEARRRWAQRAELAPALGAPHGTEAPKCRLLPMHVSGTRGSGWLGRPCDAWYYDLVQCDAL